MARGAGAATRGVGCVMSGKGRAGYKDGGSVSPRAGTQGLAKRGYKKGGAVKDCDKDGYKKGGSVSLTAKENAKITKTGRVKEQAGGMMLGMPPSASVPAPTGALQTQGAVIGAKKKKKSRSITGLTAPTAPSPTPI